MKNLERYFYISLAVVLGVLLLWRWNCSGRCPEISTTTKIDTLYLDLKDTATTTTWLRPKSIKKSGIVRVAAIRKESSDSSDFDIIPADSIEYFDVTDLFAQLNYDTIYKFNYGDIRVETDVERNKIIRQTITPTWKITETTKTVYNTEVKTIYDTRRQLYLGLDVYGTKGSIFNGIEGSVIYKTRKDFGFRAGALKINSLPMHYSVGGIIKIKL